MAEPAGIVGRTAGLRGVQLFASSTTDQRTRRPTDIALAIASAFGLLLGCILSNVAATQEAALVAFIATLPSFFDTLWAVCFTMALVWAAILPIAALLRRRPALAGQLLLAGLAAVAAAAVLAKTVGDDGRSLGEMLTERGGSPAFPAASMALATAVLTTASPHLTRPFRHFGRWLIGLQLVGVVMLTASAPSGAVSGVLLGLLAGAGVHLVYGSPGGRPTEGRIRMALADLGVTVDELTPASMQSAGVIRLYATTADGPVTVKVYGRDAWDAQLLANVWRAAWYRGLERTARLSRVELVEHEAFVTLLAERAGVEVPSLVTAGSAGQGDALVVVRTVGRPLGAVLADGGSVATRSLWDHLRRLHEAGMVHRRIDLDSVLVREDGGLCFGDLSTASVTGEEPDRRTDQAQLLVLSMLAVGEEAAIAEAVDALGEPEVAALLPYLQSAAVGPLVRKELDDRDLDLDDVRKRTAAALEIDEQPLTKLRRVTVGSLVNLGLLSIAAYTLISVFGDVDVDTLVEALREASWAWLAFALVMAQVPRIPSAVSTQGATLEPVPFAPLLVLQFAICYVNLAIPSTAARVAVNVRFFQRLGIPPTRAVSIGVIDSVSGFVIQIALFLLLFFASDVSFGITLDTGSDDLSGAATIALIALAAIVVAVLVVLLVPSVRRRVVAAFNEAKDSLQVLRSPQKLLRLFGGNLLSQVLFGLALAITAEAFGYHLPLTQTVLINTVVSLFAGLLPIPGGIGVSEAGLTYGLTAVGVPNDVALGIAMCYRIASFYLPPVWGAFCYRWLVRERYL